MPSSVGKLPCRRTNRLDSCAQIQTILIGFIMFCKICDHNAVSMFSLAFCWIQSMVELNPCAFGSNVRPYWMRAHYCQLVCAHFRFIGKVNSVDFLLCAGLNEAEREF